MTKTDKEKLIDTLVSANIIADSLLPSEQTNKLSSDELYKVLVSAYNISYDSDTDEIYYIDEKGDKFICPDMSEGMSTSAEWLCDKLPEPTLDIDQGGSVRRSSEIRSLYTLVCISLVVHELSDEIREFIDSYDFIEFCTKSNTLNDYASATEYLKSFTDLNSLTINCVVSGAAINLTQFQEKKDALWRSNLTREETLELSKISRDIKNVILKYEREEKLNPIDIRSLSKVAKLTAIEKRDLAIDDIINSSKYSTLYRITKFNSERLGAIAKRKILNVSRKIAEQQVNLSGETNKLVVDDLYDSTFYEMQRSLTRKAVSSLIDKEIRKYKNDVNNYKFRKKI